VRAELKRQIAGYGPTIDAATRSSTAPVMALYSYEGTYQMQHLIVGKAVTGFSAFV
jgi:glutaryl-CoA dehydrogenase